MSLLSWLALSGLHYLGALPYVGDPLHVRGALAKLHRLAAEASLNLRAGGPTSPLTDPGEGSQSIAEVGVLQPSIEGSLFCRLCTFPCKFLLSARSVAGTAPSRASRMSTTFPACWRTFSWRKKQTA